MLETSFPSFISKKKKKKKNGKVLIFRTFWAKNSILAYMSVNQQIGQNRQLCVIVTSNMGCLYFFGMYGKRRPIATPWYQISTPKAFIFQVHREVATNLLVRRVTKNRLVRRGLKEYHSPKLK